jgi:hypothetical protein
LQPLEGHGSNDQDRKQIMNTVPTTTVAVEAPTDFHGFRVLPRPSEGQHAQVRAAGDHVEKALVRVTYCPATQVLLVQLFEGLTPREHLRVLFMVRELVSGQPTGASWTPCCGEAAREGDRTAELAYTLDTESDAQFDELAARYYEDTYGVRA